MECCGCFESFMRKKNRQTSPSNPVILRDSIVLLTLFDPLLSENCSPRRANAYTRCAFRSIPLQHYKHWKCVHGHAWRFTANAMHCKVEQRRPMPRVRVIVSAPPRTPSTVHRLNRQGEAIDDDWTSIGPWMDGCSPSKATVAWQLTPGRDAETWEHSIRLRMPLPLVDLGLVWKSWHGSSFVFICQFFV